VTAFVQVTLATHSPDNSSRFQQLIGGLDEVQEAYSLTGSADYLVKLLVPDLKALARLLNDVFLPHESVQHVQSSIVLDRLKQTSSVPLAHLGRTMPASIAGASRGAPGPAGRKSAKALRKTRRQ
jgi:DNA-binding Lrp family transcriptional regulator